jgi:hypothetical protein
MGPRFRGDDSLKEPELAKHDDLLASIGISLSHQSPFP